MSVGPRKVIVGSLLGILLAGCGGPSASQSAIRPSTSASPRIASPSAESSRPSLEDGERVPVRALPDAPEVVFASFPEPGRIRAVAERPGDAPRELADVRYTVSGTVGPANVSVSPDGQFLAIATSDGEAPPDLIVVDDKGQEVWRADDQFGNFVWSPDSSVLAIDRADDTGLLLDLADGPGRGTTLEVSFEPAADPAASPVPDQGLHQPAGFSRDSQMLYATRTFTTGAPYFEVASRVDRHDGAVRAIDRIGPGDEALVRSNMSLRSPQQVGPDGAIADIETEDDGSTLRVLSAAGDVVSIPLGEVLTGYPVWDGDQIVVPSITVDDPEAAFEDMRLGLELLIVDRDGFDIRSAAVLDAGASVPEVVDCRDGFALVRLQPLDLDEPMRYAFVGLADGAASGFVSEGVPAGWLTPP